MRETSGNATSVGHLWDISGTLVTSQSDSMCNILPKWYPKVPQIDAKMVPKSGTGETVETVLPSRRELTLASQAECKNAAF